MTSALILSVRIATRISMPATRLRSSSRGMMRSSVNTSTETSGSAVRSSMPGDGM